jgi:hypothetical protein
LWGRISDGLRRLVALPGLPTRSIHIDVGGEGRYRGAINLNPRRETTTTGIPGRRIPRLVQGLGEQMPFRSQIADLLTVENTPLRPGAAAELGRIIRPGGIILLKHPADYAESAHQQVIEIVRGHHARRTVRGTTITRIVVRRGLDELLSASST